MSGTRGRGTIVVGFDGSAHADEAVRYAIDEAARSGQAVRAVVAHDSWALPFDVPLPENDREIRQRVEDTARRRVEAIRGKLDQAQRAVPLDVVVVIGPPVDVLVQEGRGAAMLVVGHRGRGGLRSALLGSVGLSVVLNAPCPVTVVPPAPTARDADPEDAATLAGPLPVGPVA